MYYSHFGRLPRIYNMIFPLDPLKMEERLKYVLLDFNKFYGSNHKREFMQY